MNSKQQPDLLTAQQQQWLKHLNACQAQGLSKVAYGQAHGINPKRLYSWQTALRKKGYLKELPAKRNPAQKPSPWLPVVVTPPSQTKHSCHMRLPNGIELSWDHDYDIEHLIQIIAGVNQR